MLYKHKIMKLTLLKKKCKNLYLEIESEKSEVG